MIKWSFHTVWDENWCREQIKTEKVKAVDVNALSRKGMAFQTLVRNSLSQSFWLSWKYWAIKSTLKSQPWSSHVSFNNYEWFQFARPVCRQHVRMEVSVVLQSCWTSSVCVWMVSLGKTAAQVSSLYLIWLLLILYHTYPKRYYDWHRPIKRNNSGRILRGTYLH